MSLSFVFLASLFFLHPSFSTSCPQQPQPHELPCNKSIQIRPPFFLINDTRDLCETAINIKCGYCDNSPRVYLFPVENFWFFLESIHYAHDMHSQNTLVVEDPTLKNALNTSNCGNILLSFQTSPFESFGYNQFLSFSNNITRFCSSPDLSSHRLILDREHTLNYSARPAAYLPTNCSRYASSASFEWTFSFDEDNNVILLSARYSYEQGCSNRSIARGNCGDECDAGNHGDKCDRDNCGNECDGREGNIKKISQSSRKKIILGIVLGFAGLSVVALLCLLQHKRKKLKSLSSTSKLLTRKNTSDKYFHDLDITGLQYTQTFSYEELEEATEGLIASKELGDGGFGTVYKGKLRDGRVVAVKRLYKNSYKSIEQFMNEVEILSRIHHPNLVTLYGCTAHTSRELLLVFEFVSNGTVFDHLHGPRSSENILTWPIRLSIAIETADALAYLHAVEPQIIHRDVKTNNILLDDGFHVKVGDFGLSRLFPLDVTHVSTVPQGTPGYVDPVYYQCYQLTDKSDVYSFGVVLVELISSKPAVDIARSRDEINLDNLALKLIQRDELDELADPALGFKSDPEVRKMVALVAELAFRCLQSDRDMRPSIKEVLEVLTVIQNGGYNTEQIAEIGVRKEEADLLETQAIYSPMTVMTGWMSQSTTPNTSN